MRLRAALLVASYVILVALVVAGLFFVDRQFDDAHDNECQIAYAQVTVTAVDVGLALGVDPPTPGEVAAVNAAIERLNDACGFDITPVE